MGYFDNSQPPSANPSVLAPYKRVNVVELAMQQIARGEKPRDPALGLDITEDEAEMTANIAINEQQFRALVAGEIVSDTAMLGRYAEVIMTVKLILSDIGFAAMRKAIDDAEAAARSLPKV